jgi:ribonuclease BN (tRNA processing enzyme)
MAVNLAVEWKVKKLVLFHHEPRYNDQRLYAIKRSALWHSEQLGAKGLEILTAQEGMELKL